MKTLKNQFQNRLKYFAFAVLAFVSIGAMFAMPEMDINTLAQNIGVGGSFATLPIWFTLVENVKTFRTLSEEEVSKLTDDEKGLYIADMLKHNNTQIEAMQKQMAKNSTDELEKKFNKLIEDQLSIYKNQLENQGIAMAKMAKEMEAKTSDKPVTFQLAAMKALQDNSEALEAMRTKKSNGTIILEIKDFINTKASQSAADITDGSDFAMMESVIGQIPTRRPFIFDLFAKRPTTKEYVRYTDQETVVRDAKNVAGCAASTHNSKVTWKTYDVKIEKVRDFVDVCIDMLDDYDFVGAEIRNLVDTDVKLKVDSELLLGTGAINSIKSVASTFAASGYANSVDAPTLIDLIKIAAAQISDFGQNNAFQANVVLLNPIDATLMELEKDLNNNYLIPNWITANGTNIGAVRIITNQLVPAGEAYIFDSTKGVIYNRKGITIEFAYENNDNFEKEIVTVKAYQRLNLRIRNVDANAFMHIESISAAIAAITKT